jgi:hypothetical protein
MTHPPTARSSFTAVDGTGPTVASASTSSLQHEILRDELDIERYGADDPKPPQYRRAHEEATAVDTQAITWDGPDDKSNPQNWSIRRKWAVTITCIVMTINV